MSKIFLAYRYTGEDPKELGLILGKLKGSLEKGGHEVFCTFWLADFFKENNFSDEQIYNYGLQKVDECDVFLAFVKSEHQSVGMNRESDRAVQQNKKYVLAIKSGLGFYEFRSVANEILEYQDLEKLQVRLQELK